MKSNQNFLKFFSKRLTAYFYISSPWRVEVDLLNPVRSKTEFMFWISCWLSLQIQWLYRVNVEVVDGVSRRCCCGKRGHRPNHGGWRAVVCYFVLLLKRFYMIFIVLKWTFLKKIKNYVLQKSHAFLHFVYQQKFIFYWENMFQTNGVVYKRTVYKIMKSPWISFRVVFHLKLYTFSL